MDSVSAIAAFSSARSQAQLASAIGVKMLKLANDQQKSVAALIEGAVESAADISAGCNGCGGSIDVKA